MAATGCKGAAASLADLGPCTSLSSPRGSSPVTRRRREDTCGELCGPLVRELSHEGLPPRQSLPLRRALLHLRVTPPGLHWVVTTGNAVFALPGLPDSRARGFTASRTEFGVSSWFRLLPALTTSLNPSGSARNNKMVPTRARRSRPHRGLSSSIPSPEHRPGPQARPGPQ